VCTTVFTIARTRGFFRCVKVSIHMVGTRVQPHLWPTHYSLTFSVRQASNGQTRAHICVRGTQNVNHQARIADDGLASGVCAVVLIPTRMGWLVACVRDERKSVCAGRFLASVMHAPICQPVWGILTNKHKKWIQDT
jgi:hypothetical protein